MKEPNLISLRNNKFRNGHICFRSLNPTSAKISLTLNRFSLKYMAFWKRLKSTYKKKLLVKITHLKTGIANNYNNLQ